MPSVRIPPGIIRGETRAAIPGKWHSTNLIRWQQGLLKPIGGWERTNAEPFLDISRNAHVWLDEVNNRHRAFLCDGAVWREKDGEYFDITPVDFVDANSTAARGYGSGNFGVNDFGMDDEDRGSGLGAADPSKLNRFSMDNWNDELVFSSSADGRVWVWDPNTPMTLPHIAENAPLLVQASIVTDERHLMTFGSAGFPNRVAWSDSEDRTGWNFADVTGQAGFYDLQGAGTIMTAVKLPGAILIFTSTSIWLGRYIGQPYYYGFTKIAEGCTPISAHSIAVAGSKAYWMGRRSFWFYEGGVVSPHMSTLGLDPFESMDKEAAPRRATAGFNGAYPEIWYFYPDNQDLSPTMTENNRYAIFNYLEGWWADGYMQRSFYASSPIDGFPIAGDDQGYVYNHEIGYLAEGQPRTGMVWAEAGDISFDDGENNWSVKQAMIDSALGPDSVKFSFNGRRARGGPRVQLQEKTPRADGYLDLDFTARDFSMKIEGVKDGPWSLGAFNFLKVVKRGPI